MLRRHSFYKSIVSENNPAVNMLNFPDFESEALTLQESNQTYFSEEKKDKDYYINRLNLNNIILPISASNIAKVNFLEINPDTIGGMYGDINLAEQIIFRGGLINFGLYKGINLNELNEEKRKEASEALYREVGKLAGLNSESSVIEAGCGIGFGARIIMNQYKPKIYLGLDFTPQQISRAKIHHKDMYPRFSHEQFKFIIGDATNMPIPNNSFSHVISVEAAQHFPSVEKFIKESCRVLKPEGRLIFTTFFVRNQEGLEALKAILPDYKVHCSDILEEEVTLLLNNHFEKVQVKSIGNDVWLGLEAWLIKIGYHRQWTRIWPELYKRGFLDYYLFEASGPNYNLDNTPTSSPSYKP